MTSLGPGGRLGAADVVRYLAHLGVPDRRRTEPGQPEAADRPPGPALPAPSLATLRLLHRAHLRAIPFENASVLRGEPIPLDPTVLVSKFIDRRRGGFCYELNGAFAALLESLGYRVERLGARTFDASGSAGPPLDHLCLRVVVDGVAWLADVGFGRSFVEPLRFETGVEQTDPAGTFRLVAVAAEPGSIDVEERHSDGAFRPSYRIDPPIQALADFGAMCDYQRTSPESVFTRQWLCTRATADGFVTLSDRTLVISDASGPIERRRLADDADLGEVLARWFGV